MISPASKSCQQVCLHGPALKHGKAHQRRAGQRGAGLDQLQPCIGARQLAGGDEALHARALGQEADNGGRGTDKGAGSKQGESSLRCGQSCHGQQHAGHGHGHGGLERVERRVTIDHDAGRQRHQQPGRTVHRNDQSDDVRPATEKGCDNQRGAGHQELVRTAKARSDGGETVKGGWKHGVSCRLSPGLNHERAMSGHPISGTAQSEV